MGKVVQLSKVAKYSKKRIEAEKVSLENFVTIDNILQNKVGITTATNLPPSNNAMPAYEAGHILVGNIRPYLKKIWYANRDGGCSADVLNFEVNKDYDSKFVYYSLFRDDFFTHIMKGAKGTKMPRGDKNQILEFLIPDFDLSTQQKIAAVLSALDAKIELNARINAELEQVAKTLYDYWFVQFAPHKSAGGKMVWNDALKREIPLGWEVKKLGDVLKIVRGASPRPIDDFLSTEGMPWIKISDATAADNRFITQTKQFIIEEGISKSRLLQPDTLILSNSASPAIPRITKIESCVHDGWLIIDEYTHGLTKEFMYHYFEYERPRIINLGSGSIFKNLKTEYIKGLNFLIPPVSVLEMITPEFKTISENIYVKTKESQTLTELRDWLLPMLMNGQVRVGPHPRPLS